MTHVRMAVLGLALSLSAAALAQDKVQLNTIKKVQVKGGTVEISGSRKPSFTTFPMSDPPRFVIDISEAVFSGVGESIDVPTGSRITAVKTASYGNDSSAIARVVIGFDREVEPDVQASGNSLVVKVGAGSAPLVASKSVVPTAGSLAPTGTTVAASTAAASAEVVRASEAQAKADADRKAQEQAARDAQAKAAQEQAARDAQAKAAQEQAARDAQAKAEAQRKTQEQEALRQAEAQRAAEARVTEQKRQEAAAAATAAALAYQKKQDEDAARATQAKADADRKAQEQAAREAQAKADADRKAQEQAARDAQAKAAQEQAARDAQAKAAQEQAARDAQAKAEAQRKTQEQAARDAQARADAQRKAQEDAARRAADEQRAREAQLAEQQRREAEAAQKREAIAAAAMAQQPRQAQARTATREPPAPAVVAMADTSMQAPSRSDAGGGSAVSTRRKTVTLVGFAPDKSRVYVRTNEPVHYTVSQVDDRTVVIELENTAISRSNDRRPLDTRFFGGPVVQITPQPGGGKTVRVAVTLRDKVGYQARQDGNEVSLQFAP